MSKITQRYSPVKILTARPEIGGMIEAEYGDWVRWDDYKALLDERYVALSALTKLEHVARGCEKLVADYSAAIEFLKEEVK